MATTQIGRMGVTNSFDLLLVVTVQEQMSVLAHGGEFDASL